MCVGRCSRFVGLNLVALSVLSATMNVCLLFPNFDGSYLKKNLISGDARKLPGVWAGGLVVLLVGIQSTLAGYNVRHLTCCCTRCDMLLSIIFSSVGFVAALMCLSFTVNGLSSGPYCFYHPSGGASGKWGYPFRRNESRVFNNGTEVYLFDIPVWSTVCIEPPLIVPWTAGFYIPMGLISILESVLCLSQFFNALIGMVGGRCDDKEVSVYADRT
ncbi:transmembrane 4 L6 family member 19 [Rhinophrynus dorsalis]